jgi:hypothetical protein
MTESFEPSGQGHRGSGRKGARSIKPRVAPRRSSRSAAWTSRLFKGLHGSRRRARARQRATLHQESLEQRLPMAVNVFGYPRGVDAFGIIGESSDDFYYGDSPSAGRLVIASDQADDVFVKQVASVSQDLLVANNSSFIGYQTVDDIDGYDSVFITNGTPRADVNLQPDNYPTSGVGNVSRFVLGENIDFEDPYVQGSLSYVQADGTQSTWEFTSWDGVGASQFSSLRDRTVRIVSGPGYGGVPGLWTGSQTSAVTRVEALPSGYVSPLRITFDSRDDLVQFASTITVDWVTTPTQVPELSATYTVEFNEDTPQSSGRLVPGYGQGGNEVTLPFTLADARTGITDAISEERSLGIIPATLRGTLRTGIGSFSFAADNTGVLRFDGSNSRKVIDRRSINIYGNDGIYLIRGNVVGDTIVFQVDKYETAFSGRFDSFPGTTGVFDEKVPLPAMPGPFSLTATYATYTQDAVPNDVTMFAGQDFTRELTVDLLTPGSTFNADTTMQIGSDVLSAVGGVGDYDLRASTININAPMQSSDRFMAGWSVSGPAGRSRLSQGVTPFENSPTLGLAAPVGVNASAIAEVSKAGYVVGLSVLPGREGSGYDPDSPPVVEVAPPVSANAQAKVVRISGSVTGIAITDNGREYSNGARVAFSVPEMGVVGQIVLNSGGAGYASRPNVLLYGGGGTGATAEADWDASTGRVTGIRVTNPGKDYLAPPQVYIYESNAVSQTLPTTAARATAILNYDAAQGFATLNGSNEVAGIVITNPGSGYATAPTVTITGLAGATGPAAGSGATATATISGTAVEVAVSNYGVGYEANEPVPAPIRGAGTFEQDGSVLIPADPTGRLRDDRVLSITVLDGGSGYLAAPTVTIVGGDGNATGRATLVGGRVVAVEVTNAGSGYNSPPLILFTGVQQAGGRAAVAIATVSAIQIVDGGRFNSVASTTVVVPDAPPSETTVRQATGTFKGNSISLTDVGSGYKFGEQVRVYVWGGGVAYASLPVDPTLPRIRGYYGTATVNPDGSLGPVRPADPSFSWASLPFTIDPVVYIEPPAAVAAFLAAVDPSGRVDGYVQLQQGQNYGVRPAVTVSGVAGVASASAAARIDAQFGTVTQIDVVDSGRGYAAPPRVVVAPPDEGLGGARARAVAVLDSLGRVVRIDVIDPGFGYRSRPTVEIAAVNDRIQVESLNVNAEVSANIYELYVGDDFGTETDRGRLYVSPTGGLSARANSFGPGQVTPDATTSTLSFTGDQRAVVQRGASVSGIGIPTGVRVTTVRYDPQTNITVATVTAGGLAALPANSTVTIAGGAASAYVEATVADVYVESRIEAVNQSYLFNSDAADSQLAPFVFSTRSPATGIETGRIIGSTVNITLGNRMPTPLDGSSAFSTLDITTEIDSLRMRTGSDPTNPTGPFPYEVRIREVDNLSVEAVAASSLPISIEAAGSIDMPAGLSTGGDISIRADSNLPGVSTTFRVQAPITSEFGTISIAADTVSVQNSLLVRAAPVTDGREDITLVALAGNLEINGLVSGVNDVFLSQTNPEGGSGRISGNSRVRGRNLTVRSEGSIDIGTDVATLIGQAGTGFTLRELNDLTVLSLASGGPVSLTADGVDPGREYSTNEIALRAYLTEVNRLTVSTPNGSSQVFIDTVSPVTLGDPARLTAAQSMRAAGSVEIRSTGASFTVLDAPVGGQGARLVRAATTEPLVKSNNDKAVTYNPGVPGTFAATLSGEGTLPLIDGVALVVGDLVLVKNQVNNPATVGINEKRENGIYQVTKLGGGAFGSTRWELRRSADADTSADLPTNTYVRVGEGNQAGKTFQTDYLVVPTVVGERTTANQVQLTKDFAPYTGRLTPGQLVSGTGIAPGARINSVTPTPNGGYIVRFQRVTAAVTAVAEDQLTLGSSFSGYNNLVVGQRVFGEGVLPGAMITKIDAAAGKVTVSPGSLPSSLTIGAVDASTTPSWYHGEGFDEWIELDPTFNDFDVVHVGQRVRGAGLPIAGAVVTGIDPTYRRIGFASGSISDVTVVGSESLTFESLKSVQFGVVQGSGAGYVTFDMPPLGMGSINFNDVTTATSTKVGSDVQGTTVNLVVTTTGTTNDAPGSLGKMLALRQGNKAQSVAGDEQAMAFSFGTLSGPIRLEQQLPRIVKPFAISGNGTVVIDGSRITRTRTGAAVGSTAGINGFDFGAASGATEGASGASISNITIGGFTRGAAIQVTNANGILINSVVLGRGTTSTNSSLNSNSNANGVIVSGGSATVINSTIVSSKQYRDPKAGALVGGNGVRVGQGGVVTLVGNTIGNTAEANNVGVVVTGKSNGSRLGVDPVSTVIRQQFGSDRSIVVDAVGGSDRMVLPDFVPTTSLYLGQTVTGAAIPTGTKIVAINGRELTLSNKFQSTSRISVILGTPGRNIVQNNNNGILLQVGASTLTNSDVRLNLFAGIAVFGGTHTIGTSSTLSASSNAIFGNGGWGVDVTPGSALSSQTIQGNFFGGAARATSGISNARGDVGADGKLAPVALGYNPEIRAGLMSTKDKYGNQYLRPTAARGTGAINYPWRPQ